ncbi:hypothetical protein WMY93_003729 [Mugilogobius chulae]|uniref:Uncharacterized protein n=1 Tax=Mugilogobius chulae TaxID=88201 RepID=A0AAW0PXK1_9GOBI
MASGPGRRLLPVAMVSSLVLFASLWRQRQERRAPLLSWQQTCKLLLLLLLLSVNRAVFCLPLLPLLLLHRDKIRNRGRTPRHGRQRDRNAVGVVSILIRFTVKAEPVPEESPSRFNGPLDHYHGLIRDGTLREDEHQRAVLQTLDQLHKKLRGYSNTPTSIFSKFFTKPKPPKVTTSTVMWAQGKRW